MNIDDRVEIVGEGHTSGTKHIGKTGIVGSVDGAICFVYFDVMDNESGCGAFFPHDSLELLKTKRIDFSRLEDSDLWRAARAIADISTGYSTLERLGLCVEEPDNDALTIALDRELHFRQQVHQAAFRGEA